MTPPLFTTNYPTLPYPHTRIHVVAPACWADEADLETGKAYLSAQGFDVKIHPQCYEKMGALAGDDTARLTAFQESLNDPECDVIVAARAYYGSGRISNDINFPRTPKIIVGYSDITNILLNALPHPHITPVHGPLASEAGREGFTASWDILSAFLKGENITERANTILNEHATSLRSGSASGPLVGGNLTILAQTIGTANMPRLEGGILYLEDTLEPPFIIDRLFNHLKRAGIFDTVTGVCLGSFTNIHDTLLPFGQTIEEIALHHTQEAGLPLISGLACGHGGINTPLVLGQMSHIHA